MHVVALADLFGVTTDYLLREEMAQDAMQAAEPQKQSPVPQRNGRFVMPPRELGGRLMVGTSAAGLCVLRVLSSVYPAQAHIDERHYTGFSGFLQYYDLWWLLHLLLAILLLGLLQLLGPWLLGQTKRLQGSLRQALSRDEDTEPSE